MWETITEAWNHVTAATPVPTLWVWAICAGLGVALVVVRPIWKYARHSITIVHEGGHALVGVLTGRKLNGIKLHSDTSGVTETVGVPGGFGAFLTTFAGYPFPAVLAIGLGFATAYGQARTAFAALTILLLIMLLFIRNLMGFATMGIAIAVSVGLAWFAPDAVVTGVAAVLAGFLTAGAAQSILEERLARKSGGDTDATALASRTGIPATVWWVMWLLTVIAAAYATVSIILPN